MTNLITFEPKPDVEICAVRIPNGTTSYLLNSPMVSNIFSVGFMHGKESTLSVLPPGDWRILAPTDSINRPQMREFCPLHLNSELYSLFGRGLRVSYDVYDCYASLLTHLKIEGRHLILIRETKVN